MLVAHMATSLLADGASERQPVMADEVQTFKALQTIHKVLQEGHPIAVKEAQQNVNWIESLARGVNGEGLRGEARSWLQRRTSVAWIEKES